MSSPRRIPVPAGLTIEWEQPEDEHNFWALDRMHFPHPTTRIDDVMHHMIYGPGMNHGFATYDMPMRADARRIWAHLYMSVTPLRLPDEELEAMGKRSEEKLGAAMGQIMERWETTWLPEIQEHLRYWENFDLQGASISELLSHLDETLHRLQRVWALHFEIVFPVQLPVSLFDEFYRDLFGDDNKFAAFGLVQGFDNLTVRAGTELWKLRRTAQASPGVGTILNEHAAADVLPALDATDDGRRFLGELREYLDEYGQRGESWGVSFPSWIEDPTTVIATLQEYMTQPDRDPEQELVDMAADREQHIAAARERLQSYPEPVRNQFEFLLKAAQEGNILSEDHGFWIDFRTSYQVRRVFMEFGRRFVETNIIADANDIFHLTIDEIRETTERLGEIALDRTALVAERKAEIERYQSVALPPAVGTEPPGPPPVNPMTQLLGKFFGKPPQPSANPNVLNGAAGSPGIVQGTARIIRTLADASQLRAGDILVAETTAPPWTPLFATVAAVVTDTGGVLSHCAVVAREYRIPAVVGTGMATSVIKDGQLIEVDGDRGIVRVVQGDG